MKLHWSKAKGSVMGNKGLLLNGGPLPEQQQPTEARNKVEQESQEQQES